MDAEKKKVPLVVIPKGTVVQIGGFPASLTSDTTVICGTIVAYGGFAQFKEEYLDPLDSQDFDLGEIGLVGAGDGFRVFGDATTAGLVASD